MAKETKKMTRLIEMAKSHIQENESIQHTIYGLFDGDVNETRLVRSGILITSDKNLVFQSTKEFVSYPLTLINNFEQKKNLAGHHISFQTNNKKIAFKNVLDGDVTEFLEFLRNNSEGNSEVIYNEIYLPQQKEKRMEKTHLIKTDPKFVSDKGKSNLKINDDSAKNKGNVELPVKKTTKKEEVIDNDNVFDEINNPVKLDDVTKNCPICGKKLGLLSTSIKDKVKVCNKCLNSNYEASELMTIGKKNITIEDIGKKIDRNKEEKSLLEAFKPTKKIGKYLYLNEDTETWLSPMPNGKIAKNNKLHNFSDILNFELLEDGNSITSGGLGRAALGGALFGGAGAVVGAVTGGKKSKQVCNSLRIKVNLNNISQPLEYIDFIVFEVNKNSYVYKNAFNKAQECLSTLQAICDKHKHVDVQTDSAADEIQKYKQLLDSGAITQEEYEAKKRELLGL